MNEEEIAFIQQQEAMLKEQQAKQQLQEVSLSNQQEFLQEQERNMAKEQLDISDVLHKIYHLLQGDMFVVEDGKAFWKKPENFGMKILTPYGVQLIMNTIQFYINKNTLLSNYTDEIIMQKMEDFAKTLNATVFMEYEKVFVQPTLEDCKAELEARIKKSVEMRKFINELTEKEDDEKKIKEELILKMGDKINVELDKIKRRLINEKLKRFLMIIRELQDAVHSTYLRAWNGQERRTLREHIHISENIGGNQYGLGQQRGGSMVNPFNWFKRR